MNQLNTIPALPDACSYALITKMPGGLVRHYIQILDRDGDCIWNSGMYDDKAWAERDLARLIRQSTPPSSVDFTFNPGDKCPFKFTHEAGTTAFRLRSEAIKFFTLLAEGKEIEDAEMILGTYMLDGGQVS